MTAARRIVLTGSDEIILQAPKVTVITQGAQTAYGGGAITHQCTGEFGVRSANVAFTSPGDGDPAAMTMPQSSAAHDQRVRVVNLNTGEPIANQRYRATMEDGQIHEGTTDAEGLTQILKSSIPFGQFAIQALYD